MSNHQQNVLGNKLMCMISKKNYVYVIDTCCIVAHRGGCLSLKIILKQRIYTSFDTFSCITNGATDDKHGKNGFKIKFYKNMMKGILMNQDKKTMTFSGKFPCLIFTCKIP